MEILEPRTLGDGSYRRDGETTTPVSGTGCIHTKDGLRLNDEGLGVLFDLFDPDKDRDMWDLVATAIAVLKAPPDDD